MTAAVFTTEDPSSALARCRRIDRDIHAWAHLPGVGQARPPAHAGGPLQGLAFGVKDVIDVSGMPTRSGSTAMPEAPRELDATCVAQLRDAGAVPIGKTVTAEFAYAFPGPTRNPRHAGHTPGGSSSGSAAAVAAGMVELALGTQTGGSIIRPAAFCGVVGFKPTFGRVHRQGMQVLCDTLDTIGWFTRSAEQARAIAGILLGPSRASDNLPASPRVAMLPCRTLAKSSASAQDALAASAARLRETGAQVCEPDCDAELERLLFLHGEIMLAELARGLLPLLRARPGALSAVLLQAVERGLKTSYQDYVRHQQDRNELASRWRDAFGDTHLIVTLSAPSEAPAGLTSTGTSVFNRVWSLLGWPSIHLPTGKGADGLPVGIQCVALPDRDMALLDWACQLHGSLQA